jgi:AcrR family transcriptional regulator
VLAAANELFYNEGVHTAGIDRIVEQADMAKASLYSTIGSKDELVRSYLLARRIRRRRRAQWLRQGVAAVGEGSVTVRLAFERLQSSGTADPADLAAR